MRDLASGVLKGVLITTRRPSAIHRPVANVYVRPTVASPASLQAFLDGLAAVDPDFVLGDFNAGGSWSAKRTRLQANDLTLAAAPRRTHIRNPNTHIRGSCIDLFLLRAELGGRALPPMST
jgi:hypothetical protein